MNAKLRPGYHFKEFFDRSEPSRQRGVLLSVSLKDTAGLPSPEALQAVAGYRLLHTDRNGWIELSTDGEQMWVEGERK